MKVKRKIAFTAVLLVMFICTSVAPANAYGDEPSATCSSNVKTVYVNCDRLTLDRNVYAFYMDPLEVVDSSGSSYTVKYDGELYTVYAEEVTETKAVFHSDNPVRQTIIDAALKYASMNGAKTYYNHGNNKYSGIHSPNEAGSVGFDCSGFAGAVLEKAVQKYIPVYDLPPSVEAIYKAVKNEKYLYNKGYKGAFRLTSVDISSMLPGDIIIFDQNDKPGVDHVGVYLGEGCYIHCNNYGEYLRVKDGKYTRERRLGGVILNKVDEHRSDIVAVARTIPDKIVSANKTLKANKKMAVKKSVSSSKTVTTIKKGKSYKLLYTDNTYGKWICVKYGSKVGVCKK